MALSRMYSSSTTINVIYLQPTKSSITNDKKRCDALAYIRGEKIDRKWRRYARIMLNNCPTPIFLKKKKEILTMTLYYI